MNRILLSLLAAVSLVGCASKPKTASATDHLPDRQRSPTATAATSNRTADEDADAARRAMGPLSAGPVYFELDSATLRPESRDMLAQLATSLREQPLTRVTVSGHTCELGTTEYNVALGHRRAAVVRDYLRDLGVEPRQLSIVSYGEEQPLSEAHTEEAFHKNRRAEFTFSSAERATR
ncbi:OmpA family protein [Myxococcus vastator]|uniref:OmpA family protein n=1 Tax=Myxococcus vastator TaxID=2709664 RepID=UPI0013CFAE58|nr:OmpA family protein [Myxococcus vastator]